jgi:renalase
MHESSHIAIVGAGMAGITCARTLVQAGHRVSLFDKSARPGGRMATRASPFGGFDHGEQYFTVRDQRFALALQTVPGLCKPWSANTVRVLDEQGRVAAAGLPAREPHWVPAPGMNSLPAAWAAPLASSGSLVLETRITRLERDASQVHHWRLHAVGPDTADGHRRASLDGFDAVLLALPAWQARELLLNSELADGMAQEIDAVQVAPCWTLMLAFPNAMQPSFSTLGPQWNAARSTHHRIAWLARESSKPGREPVERWTVQAKLCRAFSEVTGIRAEASHAQTHRWAYAKTLRALGKSHLWDPRVRLGVCGDWCIGHRVEDAFLSGLGLALTMA